MNKYEILGTVGEGAYGVVLKCRNKHSGEIVAIKKFKESEEDAAVRKTTVREVKLLKMLKHPNIVMLKEAFRRKGKLFLVFEYLEKNLLEVLEAHPCGLDKEVIRRLIFQLCKSIAYCHSHHVIHRDIKPENLLVNRDFSLRLCDFGFARMHQASKTELTDYVATRWYRSPELLVGTTKYDKSVDMWAIGCIMSELIDGEPLFPGESEIDQLYLIQQTLGDLTTEQLVLFESNVRFRGYSMPTIAQPETLRRRFGHKVSKSALNFLTSLIQVDPEDRMEAALCLQHPYFAGLDGDREGNNELVDEESATLRGKKGRRRERQRLRDGENNSDFSKKRNDRDLELSSAARRKTTEIKPIKNGDFLEIISKKSKKTTSKKIQL